MCSEEKPLSQPMIIEKSRSFYDEMKITDKCVFCDDWLQSNRKLPVRNLVIMCTVG